MHPKVRKKFMLNELNIMRHFSTGKKSALLSVGKTILALTNLAPSPTPPSKVILSALRPQGVFNLSLGRGVPPRPWNPDPVYDKKFEKILKNWYPVYDFQAKFHSFFRQNVWFLDPVYKKSSKIFEFEAMFMSVRSKNHTLKGGTSPGP